MSMTKKIGVLAAMAIVAAALTVPAMASATLSSWKDKSVPITTNKIIPGTGEASFTGSLGGVSCKEIHGSLTLEVGSTGKITKFEPTVPKCETTGGLKPCTITAIHTESLPWVIHNTTTHATVTGIKITNTLHGFLCPTAITISSIAGNDVKLTPDSATAIKNFTISGEMAASIGGNVTVKGLFTPSNPADIGTYGL